MIVDSRATTGLPAASALATSGEAVKASEFIAVTILVRG
jgi:hypothetical protein